MEFGFVLLSFYYYSLVIHRFESVSAGYKSFEIIEDRKRVEELAVHHANVYAHRKHSWTSKITKPIKKRIKKNICDQEPEVKVDFCYRYIPMADVADVGYEFDSWQANDLICVENKFWISHPPHNHEADGFELEMYRCPNIKYRDLETDEDVIIPDKYHVSEGEKHNSAILFHQNDKGDEKHKVYPKKYISNIIFELLTFYLKQEFETLRFSDPHEEADVEVVRYEEARRILSQPYQKFKRFFRSMNICGLPKSHKIHICRKKVRSFHFMPKTTLNLQDYDQHRCQRRRLPSPTTADVYWMKTGESLPQEEIYNYLLVCPLRSMDPHTKVIEHFLYLASTFHLVSASVLSRKNNWGEQFEWKSIMYDIDIREMVKDRRRLRRMAYPSEIDRKQWMMKLRRNDLKEFEEKANWTLTSVQTPVIMAKSGSVSWKRSYGKPKTVSITRKELLVEDILISYSEIKASKFAYGRFMKTYSSLDICELPHKLQKALCDSILKQSPFQNYLTPDEEQSDESSNSIDIDLEGTYQMYVPDRNINRGCSRRVVNVGIREIDSLKAKYFAMWQCPKAKTTGGYVSVYHIAKYHVKNALLLFKSSDAYEIENLLYPDAVVTKIDRENLARMVLQDIAL